MRMTMKLLAMIVATLLLSSTVVADTWTDENGVVWNYTVANGVATIGGGSFTSPAIPRSTTGDIVIPDTLGGCPVTTIAQCAFQDCKSITSLVIPDSVTSIKRSAFAYCISLRTLKFGNGVTTINYGSGSDIIMGSTTYSIFNNPFTGCFALFGMDFGGVEHVNWSNFSDCTNLVYAYFPGVLAQRSGSMPGVAGRAAYITHEAYPDGLPNPTWSDVPLKFLDGKLPTPDESYDFTFVTPQTERGLIAYYKFDGNAQDSSGYGNNGVVSGATLTADRHGNQNGAYYFGSNNFIQVSSSSSLNSISDAITVAAWVRIDDWWQVENNWAPIISKGNYQYSFNITPDVYDNYTAGRPLLYTEVTKTIGAKFIGYERMGEWAHVAVTYGSDGYCRSYVNGHLLASVNCGNKTFGTSTEPLFIGKHPPGSCEYLLGAMDELRIYNRALSDAEIQEVYALGDASGAMVQLQSPESDGLATTTVLEGNPVHLSYAFRDTWGFEALGTPCVNRVTLTRCSDGETVGTDVDSVASATAGQTISRTGLELANLQGLASGTYRVAVELNADRTVGETDYANNTNTATFSVVPSVPVTFISEGETFIVRRYGAGRIYGSLPSMANRLNYDFLGWYSDAEDGVKIEATNTVPEGASTLYAHWAFRPSQTICVSGEVSSNTTWRMGGLYVVQDNLTINNGATLSLEPGVIVKFAEGKSLAVNSGGKISAIGTRALPIVFTSIKDDANGGDTNGDGDGTTPQPGDWTKIGVYGGTATFNYVKILYSSRNSMTGAINMDGRYGKVIFENGEIAHCAYDAVGVESGQCHVKNTVIHDCLLAFRHWTKEPIVNCVIYDCGRLTQGGGQKFYNCIFSHITETWEAFSFPNNGTTYRNCCFWNEGGSILHQQATSSENWGAQDAKKVCGKNGNIWANPLFIDPVKGDFRIAGNSPCIDAGNGAYAPALDYYGSPRMNVDVIRNTGTASANGAVPDIGIYEVPGDGNIPSADLAVASVTAPATLTVGETVEIAWSVENVGTEAASGMWRDEIEIVAANGQVFSMGTSSVQAEIKPGASASFRATVAVPSAPEGTVQVRVTANKHQDLFEALKSKNNVKDTTAMLAVPTLAVPTDGTATMITIGGDSDVGFALRSDGALAVGGVLLIRGAGELDAWLGNGSIAAKDNAIRTAVKIADDTWLLQIPAGSKPRVTVRNDGEGAVATQLSLEVGVFFLLDTGKMSAVNSGIVSVPFMGNGFDGSLACWLERNGTRIDPADLTVESGISARAAFDVTGREVGDWVLHVKKGTDETSATFLTLTESRIGPKWYGDVDHPDVIRSGRAYVGTFRYGNSGDTATNAPYVRLEAKGDTLIRFSETDAWSKSIELIAASGTSPAGVLKPGDSSKVSFFYKTTGAQAEIDCACTFSSPSNVPWASIQKKMRPSWANDDLWYHAYYVLKARFGETWDDYLSRLRDDCDMMLKTGQPNVRVDRMMQLELDAALGNDIAVKTLASATDLARSGRGLSLSFARSYQTSLQGRMSNGPLGTGWTHNYSTYAELQDASTLVFHLPSGGSYSFTKASGAWMPVDARDKTTLKETTTSYTLTYANGTVQTFARSNMRTSSIRDNQGNKLTFSYSGTNITKVVHTDGQSLTFNYSDGKLVSVVDDQGRSTSYTYSGDLLTSVTSFNGLTTSYEYETLPVKLVPYMTNTFFVAVMRIAYSLPYYRKSASKLSNDPPTFGEYKQIGECQTLSKITYPDGTTRDFAYDESARVASISVNGGNTTTTIDRDSLVTYSITAPNGAVTKVVCGVNGETLSTVNGLGQTVSQTYTADTLLESVIAPSGKRSKITYDKDGSPIASMSASGATTAFSYTSEFDNLASVTDAKGHSFNYGYDDKGRSTSVTYADGSASTIEYNARGDVAKSTNRRGESITYEYDAEGNLTKKTWPNGRTFTIVYDAKGNVTNATDSVTGAVTMEYDANERLTRIVYPKGRGFTYTYDAVGRMTERTALGGSQFIATEKFTYDSLGRLSTVTDGDGAPYLTNAYDPTTGWLVTQTYGNGTIVSNAYDILGRTIGIYHLVGRAVPSAPPLAFFEYAYDADGKCISQTTAEGTESYTYDADGQLTSVTYPDGTSESFTYDAVGNRITHTTGGSQLAATAAYTVNNLNQYTRIDDTTLEYDLDGNMTRKGDTHYYYDTLNRLVAVTNIAKNIHWSCEYDVFGNRVSVTDNGTITEKVFVQGSLPSVSAEYVNGSLTKRHILVGAVRLADLSGGSPSSATARYYHSDLLGSARLLTDGTGATKGTRSFKAFGETRISTGETTDAGYVGTFGVETDSNGLLFMRNRYYEAGMGRFVQIDPVGINGQDCNLYGYCHSNPVLLIDPDGNSWKTGAAYALMSIADHANAVGSTLGATAGFPGAVGSFVIGVGAVLVKHGADLMLEDEGVLTSGEVLQNLMEGLGNAWFSSMIPDKLGKLWTLGNWIEGQWADMKGYISWVLKSLDPNEFSGPLGTGEKRYVEQGEWMNYTIYFENMTNATAAAQEVFVDLPMDENLDWSTLELGEIAFGEHIDTGLQGKSHGKTSYALPGTNTSVKTEVKMKDGVLSWYIRDWDPTTADNFPASATGGFLPPNDPETHCGEGHLSFRVRVKSDAPDGAVINASATIVFDSNAPIETDPSWWNTVGTFHDVELEIDGVTTNLTLIAGEPFGELPTPTQQRIGYTFDAWYTGKNGTGLKATPDAIVPEGEFTLYANWVANPYTVHFDANGGEGAMSNQAFEFDKPDSLAANAFTLEGYSFNGWATNATGEAVYADRAVVSNLTSVLDAVVDLYATWTVNSYSVTFDANGGEGGWSREMAYGAAIVAPTVTREGYTFAGWQPALLGTVPANDVTFTALWEAIAPGTGLEPEPPPVEEEKPCLWSAAPVDAVLSVAATYEGYLYDANGNVKGTIQVKVGKPNKKTGFAAVKATVVGLDGKKKTLKAAEKGKAQIAADGPTTVSLVGGEACEVTLGAKGMAGKYGGFTIDGALNVFTSKDAADKAVASGVLAKWQGVVNVAWRLAEDGSPYQTLSVTIAAKGKAKVSGTLADGTKVSAKGQLIVGEEWCCVPVVYVKKGAKLAFGVWLPLNGQDARSPSGNAQAARSTCVVGLGEGVIVGKPGTLKAGAAFRIDADAFAARWGQRALPYLPDGVAVEGGAKWTLPKAGKVQLAKDGTVDAAKLGENPSALKLTYKAKDGSFKGSFKAYADVGGKPKATTVKVVGVLVNGTGYGAATVKGGGGAPVKIE